MFEHGPKRHSYQLWEVKFQCPAKESTVETDQRLSKELARYILPSGGPSPLSRPLKSILTCVLCQTVLRSLCPSPSTSRSLSPVPSAFPSLPLSLFPFFFLLLPLPFSFSVFLLLPLSSSSFASSRRVPSVQIKLIFERRTLLSYEFYHGRTTHGMEMFSRYHYTP